MTREEGINHILSNVGDQIRKLLEKELEIINGNFHTANHFKIKLTLSGSKIPEFFNKEVPENSYKLNLRLHEIDKNVCAGKNEDLMNWADEGAVLIVPESI